MRPDDQTHSLHPERCSVDRPMQEEFRYCAKKNGSPKIVLEIDEYRGQIGTRESHTKQQFVKTTLPCSSIGKFINVSMQLNNSHSKVEWKTSSRSSNSLNF